MLNRADTRESGIFTYGQDIDRDHGLAEYRTVAFVCPKGHQFTVRFSIEADLPASWDCRTHSAQSRRIDTPCQQEVKKRNYFDKLRERNHWDMLAERRSIAELEALLAEQIKALRAGSLVPVTTWLSRSQVQDAANRRPLRRQVMP